MERQRQTTEHDITDVSDDRDTVVADGGSLNERSRARFYRGLLYANAAALTALIAISFILPLTEAEHWTISLVAAGLLGMNLAMIDEARRRERRYRKCDLDSNPAEDYSDLFIDF